MFRKLLQRLSGPVEKEEESVSIHAANIAREHARQALRQDQGRGPEITAVTTSLQSLRETNHFGPSIEAAFAKKVRHA